MFSLEEQRQLITGWNDTKRDYPRDKCIHQLFEAQVERTPDAVAVVSGRVLKHRIPTQQVQTSTGEIQVIRYREIYVLLVRPS